MKAGYEEGFWRKVQRDDGCWMWTAGRDGDGYGSYRNKRAHRVAWQLTRGPIPDGLVVCHSCDNPACVRPDHLFLGTQQDNIQDMLRKGRRPPAGRLTHCKHGHEFTQANTRVARSGARNCRECDRVRSRRNYYRRRAA